MGHPEADHAEPRESYVDRVLVYLQQMHNFTNDMSAPHMRPALRYVYPMFIFLYAAVGTIGVCGNAAMLLVIGRRRLYHDQSFLLLANLAVANLVHCLCALPITLANMLIQNWLFGSFLCFFLPMLQSFPQYTGFLTLLMVAIDRYRLILHPFKSRLPAGLCIIAVWVAAVCAVLPFAIYIKYIDLEATLGPTFQGVGICYVYMQDRIEEFVRALFVTLYVMPFAVIAFLYVRISAELKSREATTITIHFAATSSGHSTASSSAASTAARELIDHAYRASSTWTGPSALGLTMGPTAASSASSSPPVASLGVANDGELTTLNPHHLPASNSPSHTHSSRHHHHHPPHGSQHHRRGESRGGSGGVDRSVMNGALSGCGLGGGDGGSHRGSGSGACGIMEASSGAGAGSRESTVRIRSYTAAERSTQDSDDDLDLTKEKRTQNYLITMTTVIAMCWCPLNILILVHYFVHEDDNNERSYDITYMTFAWFAYLSTCTTPVLFASWRMSNAAKDRLKGYFRFSNRRHNHGSGQRRHFHQKHYMNRSSCCNIYEEQMIMDRRSISHDGDHV